MTAQITAADMLEWPSLSDVSLLYNLSFLKEYLAVSLLLYNLFTLVF